MTFLRLKHYISGWGPRYPGWGILAPTPIPCQKTHTLFCLSDYLTTVQPAKDQNNIHLGGGQDTQDTSAGVSWPPPPIPN